MGRPKQDPTFRFSDVGPYLHKALEQNGLRIELGSRSQAIHICHRLNLYRKILRETSDQPLIAADNFVFRATNGVVEIFPRPQADLTRATTLDGRPVDFKRTIVDPLYRPNTITEERLIEMNKTLRELGQPEMTLEEANENLREQFNDPPPIDHNKPLIDE